MAQKYKTVGADGQVTGGPVYYIRAVSYTHLDVYKRQLSDSSDPG